MAAFAQRQFVGEIGRDPMQAAAEFDRGNAERQKVDAWQAGMTRARSCRRLATAVAGRAPNPAR
jgi:hypothetical protein